MVDNKPGRDIPVEVPGDAYWRRQTKCRYACPVNTDARGYLCPADAIIMEPSLR